MSSFPYVLFRKDFVEKKKKNRKDFVALKVHIYSPVFPSNLLKFN